MSLPLLPQPHTRLGPSGEAELGLQPLCPREAANGAPGGVGRRALVSPRAAGVEGPFPAEARLGRSGLMLGSCLLPSSIWHLPPH